MSSMSAYLAVSALLQTVKQGDKLAKTEEFIARLGYGYNIRDGFLCRQGTGEISSNDLKLLALCSDFVLVITNTVYQLNDTYKNTTKQQRSGQ